MDFRYEHFKNIYEFDKALKTRKQNSFMGHESHDRSTTGWYGTETFDEAQELLEKGWNSEVQNIKDELKDFSKTVLRNQNRTVKSVQGFMPCVPNAIKGVPKSMYALKKLPVKKQKTVRLIINNTSTGGTTAQELMKCGLTVLKLAVMLDKKAIRTRIDVVPKASYNGNSCYGCSVTIKDYRQPMNISKMAYPLAHVSLFRRHGFKWLETLAEEGFNRGFADSYGCSLVRCSEKQKQDFIKYAKWNEEGSFYIDLAEVKRANFDPVKLAENLGL